MPIERYGRLRYFRRRFTPYACLIAADAFAATARRVIALK